MITVESIKKTCKYILAKKVITSSELIFLLIGRRKGLVNFLLIDVREAKEHKNLSIDGTDILFSISKLHLYPDALEDLRHENLILYCAIGNRTTRMINKIIKSLGFTNYAHLKGGIINYGGDTIHNQTPPITF